MVSDKFTIIIIIIGIFLGSVILFSRLKLFVKAQEPCIENMFFEKFWVPFIYKENFIYKKRGKVAKGKSLREAIK